MCKQESRNPNHLKHGVLLLTVFCICFPTLEAQTRHPAPVAPTSCVLLKPPLTAYGFSVGTIRSLGYARDAITDGTPQNDKVTREADNALSLLTGVMRDVKLSSVDFACAKESVLPFTTLNARARSVTEYQAKNITVAAQFLAQVYQENIDLNNRLLTLLKKLSGNSGIAELSDELSTLQVKRGQLWGDVAAPVAMALGMLIDLRATDENGNFIRADDPNVGQTRRLTITKSQKRELLDSLNSLFPELQNDTPEEKLTEPAKIAKLYLNFFDGRKCSDD